MFNYNPLACLPSSEELPSSDDTPVDNELQILIPNLLLAVLATIWENRDDWFFGVNMGVYYTVNKPAIVPDAFLSLGVERFVGEQGRLSYVFWEEDGIPPILTLEIVSQTYNYEYEQKKLDYAQLGILYYVIYAPTRLRKRRQRLEVYRLVNGEYVLLPGDQIWMPEIGLGIGRERGKYQGITREWLYWYDEDGNRYLTPEEVKFQSQQELAESQQELAESQQELARSQAQLEELLIKLQQRGIDPNTL
ncbi:Uma2 family endonuclease [Cylindrospermum sp. FACHB-282]|uniref:Uma2 family endonuclease n=1 Tax=Cylindrospermum sp. FACHB-282 TaxID=2692794 RepID=UPI0016850E66|nr:Uma2 family endonuclease [Cylindrospermum sp. FACHB-282]MBD2384689.1 Uma2 family endonuclease [Cylindrospermum sp. FACHB-282]